MLVGQYWVTGLDLDGKIMFTLILTASSGHPALGEELEIESRAYRVIRVMHRRDPLPAERRRAYTYAHIFVTAIAIH